MRENDRNRQEELALRAYLPELPPDEIAAEVTPWKRAMGRVLAGLALTTVTLNFLGLQYIQSAIGTALTLLGFRALRRENRAFCICWILSVLRAALTMAVLWAGAAVDSGGIFSAAEPYAPVVGAALTMAMLLAFARALEAVKKKAGQPETPNGAGWLALWYAAAYALALVRYSGWIGSLALLAVYALILRGLFRLSRQIDAVGYAIEPAPVRLSDGTLAWLLALVLAAGLACGYLFFGQYPMDWTVRETEERAEIGQIREELRALGCPENVLDDLSAEEIAACAGATEVVTVTEDHPVNQGREVRTQQGNTTQISRAYDTRELRITGVGVRLRGERETWRIVHHFEFVEEPAWFGTESVQLWPASHVECWSVAGAFTGRLLMERDGVTYCAPYRSLGWETYTGESIFWGQQTQRDVFGTFSLPRDAERQRGYVAYTAVKAGSWDGIIDSWINYTHQRSPWQYPVRTAREARMAGLGWSGRGAFTTVQDALQFFPTEDGAELIR